MRKPITTWAVFRQRWCAGEFEMVTEPWEQICTIKAVSEAQAIARAQYKYGLQRDPVEFAGAEHGVSYKAEVAS